MVFFNIKKNKTMVKKETVKRRTKYCNQIKLVKDLMLKRLEDIDIGLNKRIINFNYIYEEYLCDLFCNMVLIKEDIEIFYSIITSIISFIRRGELDLTLDKEYKEIIKNINELDKIIKSWEVNGDAIFNAEKMAEASMFLKYIYIKEEELYETFCDIIYNSNYPYLLKEDTDISFISGNIRKNRDKYKKNANKDKADKLTSRIKNINSKKLREIAVNDILNIRNEGSKEELEILELEVNKDKLCKNLMKEYGIECDVAASIKKIVYYLRKRIHKGVCDVNEDGFLADYEPPSRKKRKYTKRKKKTITKARKPRVFTDPKKMKKCYDNLNKTAKKKNKRRRRKKNEEQN